MSNVRRQLLRRRLAVRKRRCQGPFMRCLSFLVKSGIIMHCPPLMPQSETVANTFLRLTSTSLWRLQFEERFQVSFVHEHQERRSFTRDADELVPRAAGTMIWVSLWYEWLPAKLPGSSEDTGSRKEKLESVCQVAKARPSASSKPGLERSERCDSSLQDITEAVMFRRLESQEYYKLLVIRNRKGAAAKGLDLK